MKAYVFKNKDSHKGEYGWVYVHVPGFGFKEETLAIELIEYEDYVRSGNLNYKEAFLREDLVQMPDELFKEFEDKYGSWEDGINQCEQIVKEVLDADKVARTLL